MTTKRKSKSPAAQSPLKDFTSGELFAELAAIKTDIDSIRELLTTPACGSLGVKEAVNSLRCRLLTFDHRWRNTSESVEVAPGRSTRVFRAVKRELSGIEEKLIHDCVSGAVKSVTLWWMRRDKTDLWLGTAEELRQVSQGLGTLLPQEAEGEDGKPSEQLRPAGSSEAMRKEGEWSKPMTKEDMKAALGFRPNQDRKFNTFVKIQGIDKLGRQMWKIRLDGLNERQREKLDKV